MYIKALWFREGRTSEHLSLALQTLPLVKEHSPRVEPDWAPQHTGPKFPL